MSVCKFSITYLHLDTLSISTVIHGLPGGVTSTCDAPDLRFSEFPPSSMLKASRGLLEDLSMVLMLLLSLPATALNWIYWPLDAASIVRLVSCRTPAPYHAWLEDEFAKLLRARTQMPAGETLHLAHLLTQAAEGLIEGSNKQNQAKAGQRWMQHILSGADGGRRQQLGWSYLLAWNFKTASSVGTPGQAKAITALAAPIFTCSSGHWPQVLRADLPDKDEGPELRSLVESFQLD